MSGIVVAVAPHLCIFFTRFTANVGLKSWTFFIAHWLPQVYFSVQRGKLLRLGFLVLKFFVSMDKRKWETATVSFEFFNDILSAFPK